MLCLTEKLLNAAGFEFDDIEDAWVVPVPLPPVVTVECDEDGSYLVESMLELHETLHANGITYNNFAIRGGYVSVVGLTEADVPTPVAA